MTIKVKIDDTSSTNITITAIILGILGTLSLGVCRSCSHDAGIAEGRKQLAAELGYKDDPKNLMPKDTK